MIDSVDRSTARLLATLEELGELDDTLIVFLSDNGATAEGGRDGALRYIKVPPLVTGPPEDRNVDIGLLGGPRSLFHYPRGWGMVGNTPFRLYKASTHEGGVRSPLIMSWPSGISEAAKGGVRPQFQYVTDLLPTILDLAGVPHLSDRNGHPLRGGDGASFAAALENPTAPSSHPEQHEEILGHRSFYRSGWKAVTQHERLTSFDDDQWELYHLDRDPAETRDLASDDPEKVRELAEAWEVAAYENDVYPLDEGSGLAHTMHDPAYERFSEPVVLLPGTPTLERFRASRLIAHRSFVVEIVFAYRAGEQGMLLAHGGQGSGYAVYVEDGALRLAWNEFGDMHDVGIDELGAADKQTAILRVDALERGSCNACLLTDGREARVDGLFAFVGLAPLEGIDVGIDRRSPVSWRLYEQHGPFPYTGTIHRVRYLPGELALDAPQRRIEAMRAAGLRFQ
jgi:arylsulfatase